MKNVKLNKNFTQVCVWPATIVGEDKIDDFTMFMQATFDVSIQYLEEIKTGPDRENGSIVEGTGDRNDVFFAVHTDDIGKFTVPRLQFGIRWIEDAVSSVNGGNRLYPARVNDYCSW